MIEPRRTTPKRTALKYAIVALSESARAAYREWIDHNVSPMGDCDAMPPAAPRSWLDIAKAATIVLNTVDRAWVRSWTLKWVRAEDGTLAIPQRHSGNALAATTFGRRTG